MTGIEAGFYCQAVREGNLAALKVFFKDFDSKDKDERDSLIVSGITEVTSVKVLKDLISLGIPLDYIEEEKQNTLLHLAACSDYPEIPTFFIKKGFDVNARNAIGATPLMFGSCYTSNPKVLEVLLKAGTDITIKDNDNASVLCIASRYSESEDIIRFLANQGLDLEDRDDSGLTPMLSAFRYNSSIDVVLALRDVGSDVFAKSNDGDTALHMAAYNRDCSRPMLDFLRSRFRVSDRNNEGFTPLTIAAMLSDNQVVLEAMIKMQREELLYEACQNRYPGIVSILKSQGIDLNMETGDFSYPILWVARYNANPRVLEAFLDAGAIAGVRDLWGRGIFHYAAMNENGEGYEWLKNQDEYKYLDTKDEYDHDAEYYRQHQEEF